MIKQLCIDCQLKNKKKYSELCQDCFDKRMKEYHDIRVDVQANKYF